MLHGLVVSSEHDVAVPSFDEREDLRLLCIEQGNGRSLSRRLGRQANLDSFDARGQEGHRDPGARRGVMVESGSDGFGQARLRAAPGTQHPGANDRRVIVTDA